MSQSFIKQLLILNLSFLTPSMGVYATASSEGDPCEQILTPELTENVNELIKIFGIELPSENLLQFQQALTHSSRLSQEQVYQVLGIDRQSFLIAISKVVSAFISASNLAQHQRRTERIRTLLALTEPISLVQKNAWIPKKVYEQQLYEDTLLTVKQSGLRLTSLEKQQLADSVHAIYQKNTLENQNHLNQHIANIEQRAYAKAYTTTLWMQGVAVFESIFSITELQFKLGEHQNKLSQMESEFQQLIEDEARALQQQFHQMVDKKNSEAEIIQQFEELKSQVLAVEHHIEQFAKAFSKLRQQSAQNRSKAKVSGILNLSQGALEVTKAWIRPTETVFRIIGTTFGLTQFGIGVGNMAQSYAYHKQVLHCMDELSTAAKWLKATGEIKVSLSSPPTEKP